MGKKSDRDGHVTVSLDKKWSKKANQWTLQKISGGLFRAWEWRLTVTRLEYLTGVTNIF